MASPKCTTPPFASQGLPSCVSASHDPRLIPVHRVFYALKPYPTCHHLVRGLRGTCDYGCSVADHHARHTP
eukprot:3564200-Prymnesium_polylepis.1